MKSKDLTRLLNEYGDVNLDVVIRTYARGCVDPIYNDIVLVVTADGKIILAFE